MESILLSMRPERCEEIVRGIVTLDIRKKAPRITTPFKVYIYCTKPRRTTSDIVIVGHVIGEFTCKHVSSFRHILASDWRGGIKDTYAMSWEDVVKTGMTRWQLANYGCGKTLYGYEISNLEIYDTPLKLCDFCLAKAPEMNDLDEELCSYCAATDYGEHREYHTPDGVYMCEGRHCSEAYDEFLEENYQVVHAPRSFYKVKEIK